MRRRTAGWLAGLALAVAAFADASSTPLAKKTANAVSIALECSNDGYCYAEASGGNPDYHFEWGQWNTTETYDQDGVSSANWYCNDYWGWITIEVVVTDGLNQSASATTQKYCSP
jgi:hypothetical protein